MKFKILCIAILLINSSLFAQKKIVKKWLKLEKEFLHYFYDIQDYPKAETSLDEIWELTIQKIPKEDSLFAAAVATKAVWSYELDAYDKSILFMMEWLPWLREKVDAGEKLTKRHYNWFLFSGNAYVMLGENYMFNKNISNQLQFIPKDEQDRLNKALAYFDTAIGLYNELDKVRPDHPDISNNLSVAYRNKGRLLGQYMRDLESSIMALKQSNNYRANVETYRLLGVATGMSGKPLEAISYFEEALLLEGNNIAILYNLEVAYRQLALSTENESLKADYESKGDSYHMQWKLIEPDYDPSAN